MTAPRSISRGRGEAALASLCPTPIAPVPGRTEGSCHRDITALSTFQTEGVFGGAPVDVAARQNWAVFDLRTRALPEILLQPALGASPDDACPCDRLGFMTGEATLQYLEEPARLGATEGAAAPQPRILEEQSVASTRSTVRALAVKERRGWRDQPLQLPAAHPALGLDW